jgi:hypothetical protein
MQSGRTPLCTPGVVLYDVCVCLFVDLVALLSVILRSGKLRELTELMVVLPIEVAER